MRQLERLTRELCGREARWRAIFEAEPECVKLVSEEGALLEMNPAGLRMIEADSLDQVRNHQVDALVVPEHRAPFRALTRRVFAANPPRSNSRSSASKAAAAASPRMRHHCATSAAGHGDAGDHARCHRSQGA